MLLVEENFQINTITEGPDGGKRLYLEGIFSASGSKNRNQRTYSHDQLKTSVSLINEAADSGHHILGELDHPEGSNVSLKNVSHKLINASIDGTVGNAKMEILENTPSGAIAKGLIDSGVQIGISTRGSGSVNKRTGVVENYRFHTIDLVATPSCQTAYPKTLREQLEGYAGYDEIENLAEAMVHDPLAQWYFQREVQKFMKSLSGK